MKTLVCQKCKRRKLVKYFHRTKTRKTGYNCWCKTCKTIWTKENEERLKIKHKRYYQDNKERLLSEKILYRNSHKKEIALVGKKYREKNKEKLRLRSRLIGQEQAKNVVGHAVRKGKIPNLKKIVMPCVDCKINRATQWEHRDYNKPLAVDAVCQSCNILRGPAIPLNHENRKPKKCRDCDIMVTYLCKSGLCLKCYQRVYHANQKKG